MPAAELYRLHHGCPSSHPFMMPLLALLAPIGAIILTVPMAIVMCYAAAYARLYNWLACRSAVSGLREEDPQLDKAVVTVNMHGMHIEDLPGSNIITVQDQHRTHQQDVLKLFRTHGYRNSSAYTTFSNPEMQVLLLPGVGCMVFTTCQHWGFKLVVAVGDPICGPQHDLLMLQTFRAVFPAGVLIDVSKAVASLWAQEAAKQPGPSTTVTDMGTEIIVDMQRYNFEFNKRTKEIRRNADAATRAGLIVEEVTAHTSAAMKKQVQELASEWQQGKEITGDLRVLSRSIPFQHLGYERDARVFIARTRDVGEATAPSTVAMATEHFGEQEAAAAAAAAKSVATLVTAIEDGNNAMSAPPPRSSEQQRKKRARRALARQQRQQQQQQCATVADAGCAATSAKASDTDLSELAIVSCGTEQPSYYNHRCRQQQQQKQQEASAAGGSGSSSGGHIHACVILDPIYRQGEVVGYFVQRTFLSPKGPKGATKLVLTQVMRLLKAEGKCILNHGPAPAHNIKSGAYHGLTDCAWLRRSFQLCWKYGNSMYAFQNLAMAKASWGGGYSPEEDSLKYREVVTLNRRFVLLPPSMKSSLGHGPLMLLVVFRHMGLIGDPWDLFSFWRYW